MKGEHYTVIQYPTNTHKTSDKFIVIDWHIVRVRRRRVTVIEEGGVLTRSQCSEVVEGFLGCHGFLKAIDCVQPFTECICWRNAPLREKHHHSRHSGVARADYQLELSDLRPQTTAKGRQFLVFF